jgi:hypothetical protein
MVNINNHKPAEFQSIFQAAGLDKLAYSPAQAATSVDQWPTLGSLIDAGTRLVVFLDNSADFTAVPWIIDEFTNMWETKYSECTVPWVVRRLCLHEPSQAILGKGCANSRRC